MKLYLVINRNFNQDVLDCIIITICENVFKILARILWRPEYFEDLALVIASYHLVRRL